MRKRRREKRDKKVRESARETAPEPRSMCEFLHSKAPWPWPCPGLRRPPGGRGS